MEPDELKAVKAYLDHREEQRLVQFFMALRDEFEALHGEIHTSPFVCAAPFNKGKPQGRVGVGIDECAFCKQKGHWKSNCPQLMKAGRNNFKAPSSNVAAATSSIVAPPSVNSGIGSAYPSETNSHVFDLAEQFQKFLATQPHAMFASSIKGLNPSSLSDISSSIWILDYGASHHMSYDHKSFVSLNPKSSMSVLTADGTHMPISRHWDQQSGRKIGTGRRQGGLYILDELRVPDTAASVSPSTVHLSSFRLNSSSSSFYLWHFRLGHVSASRLKCLASTGALGKLQTSDISDCCGCK
ncbi:SPX domain-containing protein 1-like, partial [Trifolium pratense]